MSTGRVVLRIVAGDDTSAMVPGELGYIPGSSQLCLAATGGTFILFSAGTGGSGSGSGTGGSGGSGGFTPYVFTQSTANSTWTINHNLGFCPAVVVIDSAHNLIEGDVNHPTVNQTVLTFSSAFAGTAYLS